MGVVDGGCRVDELTLSKQILLWLPHSSSKLECSLPEARFLLESCEAEVVRNASEFYQCPEVDLGVDCLRFRHRIHKNRFFIGPVIMTLPADTDLFSSEEIEDSDLPWIAFLYTIENNGSICYNNPG